MDAANAARQRAAAEQEMAEAARERALAEQAALNAAAEKNEAQQALLATAQAHAALQRKAADTAKAMEETKRHLLTLEAARVQAEHNALAALQQELRSRVEAFKQEQANGFAGTLADARAKAEQAQSESIARQMIARLTQTA
jgi:hypothetical protein